MSEKTPPAVLTSEEGLTVHFMGARDDDGRAVYVDVLGEVYGAVFNESGARLLPTLLPELRACL